MPESGVGRWQGKTGANDTLFGPRPHQRTIPTRAKGKAQTIQQNRLARPRFPRQNGQTPGEREVELLDQNNVANGKCCQHGSIIADSGQTGNRLSVAAGWVNAVQIFIKHGNRKGNIAMRGAVNHALTNDLRPSRPQALHILAKQMGDI